MDVSESSLLLNGRRTDAGARALLTSVDFGDRTAAARSLRTLADSTPEGTRAHLLPHLQAALAGAANPDRALINLERFVLAVPDRADLVAAVAADPHALEMLVTLFAGSQFLTDILLRTPEHFEKLIQRNVIGQAKTPAQHYAEAYRAACGSRAPDDCAACPETLDGLRRYHHWELLRIGTCDLIGLLDLTTVTAQLSQLADSVIWVCLELLARAMGLATTGFVVLGMGKLGGRELNYSSDVDLLFLADGDAAAFQRLGERLIKALTEATAEGFLYRVDMRLRPWGRVGPLISTVDGYLTYLERNARLWEKQALLRARVVAGDEQVGAGFLRRAEPLLFSAGAEAVRAEVYAMKQLTESHLRQTDRIWGDVKLGEGSIRDAEFVAQYLQLAYGKAEPELRTGHTQQALARLSENGYLTSHDYRVLTDGYTFLRTVEHYLQILDYRQTHSLPADPADLRYLARRLGFTGALAGARFVAHIQQHSAAIRTVYLRHLRPLSEEAAPTQRGVVTMNQDSLPDSPKLASPFNPQSEIARHLARLSPSYAATFSRAEIALHAELAARLNDRNPVEIAAEHIEEGYWRVTIVAHDYLGELSLICGLLFAYGLSIVDGHVYTYEAVPAAEDQRLEPVDLRRKIVDVFTVKHVIAEGQRVRQTSAPCGAAMRPSWPPCCACLKADANGRLAVSWRSASPWRCAAWKASPRCSTRSASPFALTRGNAIRASRSSRRTPPAFSMNSPTPWRSTASTSPRCRSLRKAIACGMSSTSPTRAGTGSRRRSGSANCGPRRCWSSTSRIFCPNRPTRNSRCNTSTSTWGSCSPGRRGLMNWHRWGAPRCSARWRGCWASAISCGMTSCACSTPTSSRWCRTSTRWRPAGPAPSLPPSLPPNSRPPLPRTPRPYAATG